MSDIRHAKRLIFAGLFKVRFVPIFRILNIVSPYNSTLRTKSN